MKVKEQRARLAEVKRAIAERYERRAKVCGSRPRRKRYLHHAATYRRVAADLLAGSP